MECWCSGARDAARHGPTAPVEKVGKGLGNEDEFARRKCKNLDLDAKCRYGEEYEEKQIGQIPKCGM